MKKILLSVLTIGMVSAVVFGATSAYFSDTETSTLNTFTAGEINVTISSSGYYNGVLQDTAPDLTWTSSNITSELFFDFDDLKPGDTGEDTIGFRVDSSDAWACFNIMTTGDNDNGINDAESDDGDSTDGALAGELDEDIYYIFWDDDGDNVLEDDETVYGEGALEEFAPILGTTYILADSVTNNTYGGVNGSPIVGDADPVSLGFGWCFGVLTQTPVAQGAGDPTANAGFTCNGSTVDNQSQSDDVVLTMRFYGVQEKNNSAFECSTWTP